VDLFGRCPRFDSNHFSFMGFLFFFPALESTTDPAISHAASSSLAGVVTGVRHQQEGSVAFHFFEPGIYLHSLPPSPHDEAAGAEDRKAKAFLFAPSLPPERLSGL